MSLHLAFLIVRVGVTILFIIGGFYALSKGFRLIQRGPGLEAEGSKFQIGEFHASLASVGALVMLTSGLWAFFGYGTAPKRILYNPETGELEELAENDLNQLNRELQAQAQTVAALEVAMSSVINFRLSETEGRASYLRFLAERIVMRGTVIDLQAEFFSDEVEKLTGDTAEANLLRGIKSIRGRNYVEAVELLDKAAISDPDTFMVFYARGYAKRMIIPEVSENKIAAIADFSEAIKLRPDFAEAYIDRGVAYFELGNYDKAIADYDLGLNIRPNEPRALSNRGFVWIAKADYEQALRDYSQAVALYREPKKKAGALENIALAHLNRSDWSSAYQVTEQVRDLYEDSAWNWFFRGVAADKLGEAAAAREAFEMWDAAQRPEAEFLKAYLKPEIQGYLAR